MSAARRATVDTLQADEAKARRAREEALRVVRKQLGRRVDTVDMDPFTAMARGLVADGKHLRALAPTRQIGQMATPSRNRPALFTREQLAALCQYHQLWLNTHVGLGAVDPERIRVDGGGAGDTGAAMARASESRRELRRLREGLGSAAQAEILDWVVIHDRPLEDFCMKAISPISKKVFVQGARYQLLIEAAKALQRQLGY